MWEVCPICKGAGKKENFNTTAKYSHCNICAGKGIISSITGLPPDYTNISNIRDIEQEKDYLLKKQNFLNY